MIALPTTRMRGRYMRLIGQPHALIAAATFGERQITIAVALSREKLANLAFGQPVRWRRCSSILGRRSSARRNDRGAISIRRRRGSIHRWRRPWYRCRWRCGRGAFVIRSATSRCSRTWRGRASRSVMRTFPAKRTSTIVQPFRRRLRPGFNLDRIAGSGAGGGFGASGRGARVILQLAGVGSRFRDVRSAAKQNEYMLGGSMDLMHLPWPEIVWMGCGSASQCCSSRPSSIQGVLDF